MSSAVLRRRPDLRDFQIFKEADASEERRTADTLRHQIEWREYANSGYLNDAELGLILDYDKQSAEDQDDLLDELGLEYARFFVAALQKIHKERTIMYLLALVHQMLDRNPVARARDFKRLIEEGAVGGDGSAAAAAAGGAAAAPDVAASPYQPFLRILQQPTSDEFAVTKACKSLAILISYSDVDSLAPVSQEAAAREARARQVIEESVHRFVGWLVDRLLADKKAQLVSVVRALKTVLKSRMVQHVFVSENGLRALMTLVRKEVTNTQLLYNLCFCIWLMSFNEDLYADLAEQRAVAAIMDALRVVFREKVVRICLATLRNLLGKAAFNDRMIINGAMKLFPTLAARKWTDEDLVEDLEAIDEALQHHVSLLSSFDTYQTEVESGRLQWTPVHAEKFWRENVHRFEEHNFQLIQTLVNLLDSQDELTLAVCCYDLGEFARFHPDGRRLLDRFHGKSKLMIKMQSTSAQVAKQALLAVQKIMVHNWDALNASMSDSTGKKN